MRNPSLKGQAQNTVSERLTEEQRTLIRRVAERHGAQNIHLFGSWARGEAGAESDIDLLVVKGPKTSAWFPAGLIVELEQLLDRRVDVDIVTENGLSPYLREQILREAVPL